MNMSNIVSAYDSEGYGADFEVASTGNPADTMAKGLQPSAVHLPTQKRSNSHRIMIRK